MFWAAPGFSHIQFNCIGFAMVIIPALSLGYQGVPKVGTTSMYNWLFEHWLLACGPEALDTADNGPNHKRLLFTAGRGGNMLVPNTPEDVAPHASAFKFAFTRDPVKRFVSMYRNRVVHFRELGAHTLAAGRMSERGLTVDPTLDLLVERWEDYRACSGSIAHHARSQLDFLGPDLSVYDCLVDLSDIDQVIEAIRTHWRQRGQDTLADHVFTLKRQQTGGPRVGLESLSQASFDRLLGLYAAEYAQIPTLDKAAIIAEYQAARSACPQPTPIVFSPITETASPKKASTSAKPSWGLKLKRQAVPQVEHMKVEAPSGQVGTGKQCGISGILLLTIEHVAADYRLEWTCEGDAGVCEWHRPSPALAAQHQANPNAAAARWRTILPPMERGRVFSLRLTNSQGDAVVIATFEVTITKPSP